MQALGNPPDGLLKELAPDMDMGMDGLASDPECKTM